jgi:hypothetical protein
MAAVDGVREALERTVPDFTDRHGDWTAVLEKARAGRQSYRNWRKWAVAAVAAVVAVAALVLFWPGGRGGENVLTRARAAVERGPVTHVVLRRAVKVYDLERHEYRGVPVVEEEWFDPARGFHYVRTVDGRLRAEFRGSGRGPTFPEGSQAFAGIATAYRHALVTDKASLGIDETVQGRRVYWIRFDSSFGLGLKHYVVAVDAETFEPRFVRVDGGPALTLQFETLGAGEGDFTVTRPGEGGSRRGEDGSERSSWSGPSRIGPRSPEEARDALRNAVWLGERFGAIALSSVREVSWNSPRLNAPPEAVRALELCYGSGQGCAVFMTEATESNQMAAGGKGWPLGPQGSPPPGTLGLGEAPGLGYVIRDGVHVTIQAHSRDELIAAAEALRPIP